MGNITRVSSKRTLSSSLVCEMLQEINERRFGGFFRIENLCEMWEFHIPELSYPFWDFYCLTPRSLGGKRPRPNYLWGEWAWFQFLSEVGVHESGRIRDEGFLETLDPHKYVGETFQAFLDKNWSWVKPGDDEMALHIKEMRALAIEQLPAALKPFAFLNETP